MHRLTWILFALFSLVLPILSAPVAAPEGMALEKRTTHSGRVRVFFFLSPFAHDTDLSVHRELGTHPASVAAVERTMRDS